MKDRNADLLSLVDILSFEEKNVLIRKLATMGDSILGFNAINKLYDEYIFQQKKSNNKNCYDAFLKLLQINYSVTYIQNRKPSLDSNRPHIIVSNHPTGALEALISMDYFKKNFFDLKFLGNAFLGRIPDIRTDLIPVIPFKDTRAKKYNQSSIKQTLNFLNHNGKLLLYPAGNVAHFQLRRWCVEDPDWSDHSARLALLTKADVVPIYCSAKNALVSTCLGPNLQALRYTRELLNKQGSHCNLIIGECLPYSDFSEQKDLIKLTQYFRSKVESLAGSEAESEYQRNSR